MLDITPYGDCRMNVKFINTVGDTITISKHWSEAVKCKNGNFYMESYFPKNKKHLEK
jgi:hypothetical protein